MLDRVAAAREQLAARVRVRTCPGLAQVAWDEAHGHRTDVYGAVCWDDDMPVWLLDTVVPRAAWQLSSWQANDGPGWYHVIEAPRYSWAITLHPPSDSSAARLASFGSDADAP